MLNGVAGNCENIPENPFLWQVAAGGAAAVEYDDSPLQRFAAFLRRCYVEVFREAFAITARSRSRTSNHRCRRNEKKVASSERPIRLRLIRYCKRLRRRQIYRTRLQMHHGPARIRPNNLAGTWSAAIWNYPHRVCAPGRWNRQIRSNQHHPGRGFT
jgi:hypothetical protein